jgi:hypothetical protein
MGKKHGFGFMEPFKKLVWGLGSKHKYIMYACVDVMLYQIFCKNTNTKDFISNENFHTKLYVSSKINIHKCEKI